MKEIIAMACDHAGYELKEVVKQYIKDKGCEVMDFGTNSAESVDYPDYAHLLGRSVNNGKYGCGIVICGSGNGVQMTVNKYPNVRCALCWTPEIAHLGRQHNDCNVISLPARFIEQQTALQIVEEFLNTEFEGGRHQRRVEKINKILK